jgi:hypothetical protein
MRNLRRRLGALALRAGGVLVVGLVVVSVPATAASASPTQSPGDSCDEGAEPTAFLPDGCWGAYPTSNYDIGADPGGYTDFANRMYGGTTAWYFNVGKGALQLSLWTVEWALVRFDIRGYDGIAESSGQGFNEGLVSNARLPFAELAWLVLFGWAGYTALRGRLGSAGSEILVSIVLMGLSTVLMANQDMYMESTWDLMDKASTALLVVAQGDDPVDYEDQGGSDRAKERRRQVVRDLQGGIHEAFVEQPYDYLNWGTLLGEADDPDNDLRACAAARDEILASGPHGGSPVPRMQMRDAGTDCAQLAAFNEEASLARMTGAGFVLLASLVLAVLLGLVSLSVMVAKLLVVLVFVLAPFAALVAILPGYGRRLAWAWVSALIQLVSAIVVMTFVLSALLIATDGLLRLTAGAHPVERFVLLNVLVFAAYIIRERQLANLQAFAAWLADYLSTVRGAAGKMLWRRGSGGDGDGGAGAGAAATAAGLGLIAVGGMAVGVPAGSRAAVGATWLAARPSSLHGAASGGLGSGSDSGEESGPSGGTPAPSYQGIAPDLLAIDRVVGSATTATVASLTAAAGATVDRRIEGDRPTYVEGTPSPATPVFLLARTIAERWRERRRILGRGFRRSQRYEMWKFRWAPYAKRTVLIPHMPNRPGKPVPPARHPVLIDLNPYETRAGPTRRQWGRRYRTRYVHGWRRRRRIIRTNRRLRRYQYALFKPLVIWRWLTRGF